MRRARRAVVLMAVVMALAAPARGDKIVLKNGRQIVAYHVVEDGDRVRCETSAGELSIPKSIVDHVEKSGLLPMKESPAETAARSIKPLCTTERSTRTTFGDSMWRREKGGRRRMNGRRWRTTPRHSLNCLKAI